MSRLCFDVTVIELHDNIYVAREDLFDPRLPNGKLRGLLPYFAELSRQGVEAVSNYGRSFSNTHASVAFAAREYGLHAVTFTNSTKTNPVLEMAKSYGAEVVYCGPMHLPQLRNRFLKHDMPNLQRLEWGLTNREILIGISNVVYEIDTSMFDVHVIPMGTGGYASAIAYGLSYLIESPRVIGVVTYGDVQRAAKLLRNIDLFRMWAPPISIVIPPPPVAPPFPHDSHYEGLAWSEALRQRNQGKRVLFWNIGTELAKEDHESQQFEISRVGR